MGRFQSRALRFAILFVSIIIFTANFCFRFSSSAHDFSILDFDSNLVYQDYSPPVPPPSSPPPPSPPPPTPPQFPPSISCESDLEGIGSLDTTCLIVNDLNLTGNLYITGKGNFHVLPRVRFQCPTPGCSITFDMAGNFSLGNSSSIVTGSFYLRTYNATFFAGSVVNTTGFAGNPPPQTSGTPQGVDGAGGGHGGRGACCLADPSKFPEDVWGGDAYSWSSLQKPCSYGSRGGTTSKEVEYGGFGGGRIRIDIRNLLVVNGSFLADGGNGGMKGGGGSGGSVYVKAHKMTGNGRISACGGDGHAGGGGGRVSVDVFIRHDDMEIFVHGGGSYACPENAGAAGTWYDAVPRSLIISNDNMTTNTDTLLMEFPNLPLMTNVYVRNNAKAAVPLLWSRVQVQGQISLLSGGVLSFGLPRYAYSEFELLAEELLMSESEIKVYGALRMSVKIFLMWNSNLLINGGDLTVATSLLEASNLIVLRESSVIHSNANLGVHGQGLLNLSGPGDRVEAQRLVGPGSILRGPLEDAKYAVVTPKLYCENWDCPDELLHPPEDCNVNSSLSFTLQICRVEDITVEGRVEGSVVHFHRARTITVQTSGMISASGMGCTGGLGRGKILSNGSGSGGGHGGKGGAGCFKGSCIKGGISYGNADLPCELGSGSGNDSSSNSTSGGGIIVMGSSEHPLSSLYVEGSVRADGESFEGTISKEKFAIFLGSNGGPGGGSGGSILLFLYTLYLAESASLSSVGGYGSANGGGGGGGGRIHFHWSNIPTGDVYQPIASVKGSIHTGGGAGRDQGGFGENGTVTGKACPKGLYGTFCEECPAGAYKNVSGSDKTLCHHCPANELPHRAVYISFRGGITETPCPYKCISDRYHMPNCYTTLEELVYTFGGPWLFGLLLIGLLILLAVVLSVARMKFVGADELPGPAPPKHSNLIDHSFPFLESLNEVLETKRADSSQSHVYRIYFMGANTFSEPWHLSHTPPEQVKEIVYEVAFNTFVDEVNAIAAYQWWEGAIYNILLVLVYPLAWSWKQGRQRIKLQRLREFVRSEYDHACLRSCRSRALYEGIKVAATADLMLAHMDFFLGGDEKRTDLPPRLHQRFPLSLLFGGDGSYLASFSLHSDDILTSLISQSVLPTTWYRLVAGLNAQLRLVCSGRLRVTFQPVLNWLETYANPSLKIHGVRVDLAWFQATACNYCQYGLLLNAIEESNPQSIKNSQGTARADVLWSRVRSTFRENSSGQFREETILSQSRTSGESHSKRKKTNNGILDTQSLQTLEEKRDMSYLLSFVLHNTKPVGHQDLVGIVVSVLLLGDFSLILLTLLQLYSFSLEDVFLVMFILPLGIFLPFPAGINALFSHGPRRAAGLARVYALWNIVSLINVVVAFICGYIHLKSQSSSKTHQKPWIAMDESEWWILPVGLVFCKLLQCQLINRHVANLEVQDRSLYSDDCELFWRA